MADRIADKIDENLDDGAFLAFRRKGSVAFGLNVDRALLGGTVQDHDCFSGERREIDRAGVQRRLFPHRCQDGKEVAGGSRNIVAIARIIAAKRAVRTLDDALGAFDDVVQRRPKHLVERMIEGCAARLLIGRRDAVRLHGAAKARKTPVSSRHDLAVQDDRTVLVGAAAHADR